MLRFTTRRLVDMVLVMFALSVLVFVIFNVVPNGDPVYRIAGRTATPEVREQVRKDFGFDQPLPVQYVRLMKKTLGGSLISYANRTNVREQIQRGIPATASLVLGAAVMWVFFGILLGLLAAVYAGRMPDRLIAIGAITGISLPDFWIGAMLLYYLSYKVSLFPTGGYVKFTTSPWGWFTHLLLPWFVLSLLGIGFYSRLVRSNVLDAIDENYVQTARAKGLSERRVLVRHVLRNALIPLTSLVALDVGEALGGVVLIEKVFNLQGVGQYVADSVGTFDLPPIMATTLYGAFFIVLLSALADIAYAYLDPRIRLNQ